MQRHFHEELKELRQQVLKMGFLVEEAIGKAIDALLNRDSRLPNEIFDSEKTINRLEIEIDDKGHSLFALSQPMAVDLRHITAILKINTDLERMGDHAVNIAQRAIYLMKEPPLTQHVQLPEMAKATQKMLRDTLDAFIGEDIALATSVLQTDDVVDTYNVDLYSRVCQLMEKDPHLVKTGMNLVMVGHNLERIADLATNIAEDILYMKQGKEVRHRIEEQKK